MAAGDAGGHSIQLGFGRSPRGSGGLDAPGRHVAAPAGGSASVGRLAPTDPPAHACDLLRLVAI